MQWNWLIVTAVVGALMGLSVGLGPAWGILFLAAEVALIAIVIAQACDPFADAAQYIGTTLRLPGSVRGATLDAIASSMPELFSGIFFVLAAITPAGTDRAAAMVASAEGFGSTIATCAGSAVYNMILIPAFCALVISYYRTHHPTIDVEDEVISRDGVWSIGCQFLLIVALYQDSMPWWLGIVFLSLYCVYIYQLHSDARLWRARLDRVALVRRDLGADVDFETVFDVLRQDSRRISRNVADRLWRASFGKSGSDTVEDEEIPETSDVLFGLFRVRLTMISSWGIIGVSTIVAAGACYHLVEATRAIATELAVPTFFVAVIVAAAASSVPDTLLSIGAAMRGDDSGAVSNAFGSNIFDICVCLSVPLLVNSWLTGWEPVTLLQDGKPIPGLTGLRILLAVLTVFTLAIMWHNRQLTRRKAFVLCGLYAVFIAYAVAGSMGWVIV